MSNEERKLEAIKKAYGEFFEECNPDENGWTKYSYCPNESVSISDLYVDFTDNYRNIESELWRPKSLAGVENNRQWIRIEEDGSNLPKEEDEYMFYTVHGKITKNYYNPHWEITNRKKYLDAYTHYQPIIKPELPLW